MKICVFKRNCLSNRNLKTQKPVINLRVCLIWQNIVSYLIFLFNRFNQSGSLLINFQITRLNEINACLATLK